MNEALVLPFGELVSDHDYVYCHLCGRGYKQLAFHLRAHAISPDAYREMCGLKRTQQLCSPRETERLRARDGLRPYYTNPEFLARASERMRELRPHDRTWREQTRSAQMPSRFARWTDAERARHSERLRDPETIKKTLSRKGRTEPGTTRAPHGTISRYGWGCHCQECRKAAADQRRDYDRKRREMGGKQN